MYRDEPFEIEDAQEDSDDLDIPKNGFEDIIVAFSDWTISTIFNQIGNQINLDPDFQRRDVWPPKSKSLLIESLILGIPIPQILLASSKEKKGNFIVLDGKQRLLAIREFLTGEFGSGKKFKLSGLKILNELNGKSWNDIERDYDEFADQLRNSTIRTSVMKNWSSEEALYEIFYRLNNGSVKLSPMELRMSLHPGPFLKFIISWSDVIGPLHALLNLKKPDKRMADVELAVKYLAFNTYKNQYTGDLKKFLDNFCMISNEKFTESENFIKINLRKMNKAISLGLEIFPEGKFCRKCTSKNIYESRFNRALFDVLVGAFSNDHFYEFSSKNKDIVKDAYEKLCIEDPEFIRAVEASTKNVAQTRKRFEAWYYTAESISKIKLTIPDIVEK